MTRRGASPACLPRDSKTTRWSRRPLWSSAFVDTTGSRRVEPERCGACPSPSPAPLAGLTARLPPPPRESSLENHAHPPVRDSTPPTTCAVVPLLAVTDLPDRPRKDRGGPSRQHGGHRPFFTSHRSAVSRPAVGDRDPRPRPPDPRAREASSPLSGPTGSSPGCLPRPFSRTRRPRPSPAPFRWAPRRLTPPRRKGAFVRQARRRPRATAATTVLARAREEPRRDDRGSPSSRRVPRRAGPTRGGVRQLFLRARTRPAERRGRPRRRAARGGPQRRGRPRPTK